MSFTQPLEKGLSTPQKNTGEKILQSSSEAWKFLDTIQGLEMSWALAVGPRHSHLDNAGYAADQKAFNHPITDEQVVDYVIDEEDRRNLLNCIVPCLFGRNVYTYENIIQALKSLGIETNRGGT